MTAQNQIFSESVGSWYIHKELHSCNYTKRADYSSEKKYDKNFQAAFNNVHAIKPVVGLKTVLETQIGDKLLAAGFESFNNLKNLDSLYNCQKCDLANKHF